VWRSELERAKGKMFGFRRDEIEKETRWRGKKKAKNQEGEGTKLSERGRSPLSKEALKTSVRNPRHQSEVKI